MNIGGYALTPRFLRVLLVAVTVLGLIVVVAVTFL
jgi:hypothetical protein